MTGPLTPEQVMARILARRPQLDPLLAQDCAAQALELVGNYLCGPAPQGLFYTCMDVALCLLDDNAVGSGEAAGQVTSISEGDTTIQFAAQQKSGGSSQSLLSPHLAALNRYRKGMFA